MTLSKAGLVCTTIGAGLTGALSGVTTSSRPRGVSASAGLVVSWGEPDRGNGYSLASTEATLWLLLLSSWIVSAEVGLREMGGLAEGVYELC